MADVKITDLPAASSVASTDVLPIVDLTGGTTRKVAVSTLMATSLAAISSSFVGSASYGQLSSSYVLLSSSYRVVSSSFNALSATFNSITGSQFVTLAAVTNLPNERILSAGFGLTLADAGAGGNVSFGINNNFIATISGSTFTGPVLGATAGGFTGSLTRLRDGSAFIVGQGAVTVTSGANGSIIISGSGGGAGGSGSISAPIEASYLVLNANAQLSSERIFTAGTGISLTDGGAGGNATVAVNNNVVATVSGTTFTGAVLGASAGGFTGSLTRLRDGSAYIVGQGAVTVTSGSNGSIIISGSGGSGSGAPTNSPYVTMALDGGLSAERVLAAGTGLSLVDGGAGGNATFAINNNIVATVSGGRFTGQVDFAAQVNHEAEIRFNKDYASPFIRPTTQTTDTPTTDLTIRAQQAAAASTGLNTNGGNLVLGGGAANTGGQNGSVKLQTNAVDRFVVNTSTISSSVPFYALSGLSGSLTKLSDGTSFINGTGGLAVTTASNGSILISGSVGAPPTAQYIVLGADAQLVNDRVLTAGNGMNFVNAGVGSTLTTNVNNVLTSLTSALSYSSLGAGTLNIQHSGSVITTFDSVFRTHNIKGRAFTTGSNNWVVASFLSGVNGRSYGVDAFLTAQHTSTIECGRWKLSGHYRRSSTGIMVLIASDPDLTSSNITGPTFLSGTLTSSAGNIIVQANGTTTGTFYWGAEMRIQEMGV